MKTTKKLNLNDLKVESFVTSMENDLTKTVKGGSSALCAAVAVSMVSTAIVSAVGSAAVSYYTAKNGNKICDTAAYCGNSHDGGNGCSQEGICNGVKI